MHNSNNSVVKNVAHPSITYIYQAPVYALKSSNVLTIMSMSNGYLSTQRWMDCIQQQYESCNTSVSSKTLSHICSVCEVDTCTIPHVFSREIPITMKLHKVRHWMNTVYGLNISKRYRRMHLIKLSVGPQYTMRSKVLHIIQGISNIDDVYTNIQTITHMFNQPCHFQAN